MAYPQFSKATLTTLVFSRGPVFPVTQREVFNQIRRESDAGTVRVATLGSVVTFLDLHFVALPLADYTALGTWVRHALINGSAQTFTYTDVRSVAYTVRWWNDNFVHQTTEGSYLLYDLSMTLRVEL
jgi:hypothetical protein